MKSGAAEAVNRIDPVCGKHVGESVPGFRASEYKKRRYYFCSEQCQHTFHQQTERFRMQELARAGALLHTSGVRWGLA